ncbi:MAG: mitochondrial fission ELM1 family protein [Hyphomicrobiales bacterium]|nr:mitochondrial fission ELM1 family protein [Hyphomicrobiales bacterium]
MDYRRSQPCAQALRGWIISDGKAGHLAITTGVAEAMGLQYKIIPVAPRGLRRIFAPWVPVSPAKRPGGAASPFRPPWPDFVFAAGRTTIPYLRAIYWAAYGETFTVAFQDPRIGARTADLIWAPLHDKLRGPNVINTPVAPHGFTPQRLAAIAAHPPEKFAALPSPRIAVLIGGPSGAYVYSAGDASRFERLLGSAAKLGASFMMTGSRRTPAEFLTRAKRAVGAAPHIVWSGTGENPYAQFLACADLFLVTSDSVNMTGEAAATGRPVYVFHPSGGRAKFERFHETMRGLGVTRDAPEAFDGLGAWSYAPLDAAGDVAAEIMRRWRAARRAAG